MRPTELFKDLEGSYIHVSHISKISHHFYHHIFLQNDRERHSHLHLTQTSRSGRDKLNLVQRGTPRQPFLDPLCSLKSSFFLPIPICDNDIREVRP